MLPGASGSSPMPRKIAGSAMITIEPSIALISTPSVVLDSATHLYRSPRTTGGPSNSVTDTPRN